MVISESVRPNYVLSTDRLSVEIISRDDLDDIFRLYSDPRVMGYWSFSPWQSFAQAEAWFERIERGQTSGDALQFVIKHRKSREVLGVCTLFQIDRENRRAEIGYALNHAAWGQGYMHEALVALVNFGFTELNLHRIEADIDPSNTPSAKSLSRLGFQQEGLLRERWIVDGTVSDSAMYGLLAPEWRRRSQA